MPTRRTKMRTGSAFPIPEAGGFAQYPTPRELLAIDPGTRHCGMAEFEWAGQPPGPDSTGGWVLRDTWDELPVDCLDHVFNWLLDKRQYTTPAALVAEGFQLYPSMLQEQGFSRMGTPEVLGAVKWEFLQATAGGPPLLRFYEQGASIKNSGRRWMEERGIEQTGSNIHKRDAEAHGWFRIKLLTIEAEKARKAAEREAKAAAKKSPSSKAASAT